MSSPRGKKRMSPSVGSPSKVLNMSWVPEGMDSNPRLEHVPLPLLSKSPAVNTKSKRGRRKKTSVGEGVTGYGRLFFFFFFDQHYGRLGWVQRSRQARGKIDQCKYFLSLIPAKIIF
ncbi:hypothetical protein PVAP13_8KG253800 [Panicum virgatum]|uniref:Uncharacterized protein n=1 Tax=Panicum virgatum TaxID=38727 RepID=A0A8T0PLQ3_PANVG|nr:hypothetical protein PVAP13_8KG253800 [Panicum virgatum]